MKNHIFRVYKNVKIIQKLHILQYVYMHVTLIFQIYSTFLRNRMYSCCIFVSSFLEILSRDKVVFDSCAQVWDSSLNFNKIKTKIMKYQMFHHQVV